MSLFQENNPEDRLLLSLVKVYIPDLTNTKHLLKMSKKFMLKLRGLPILRHVGLTGNVESLQGLTVDSHLLIEKDIREERDV